MILHHSPPMPWTRGLRGGAASFRSCCGLWPSRRAKRGGERRLLKGWGSWKPGELSAVRPGWYTDCVMAVSSCLGSPAGLAANFRWALGPSPPKSPVRSRWLFGFYGLGTNCILTEVMES